MPNPPRSSTIPIVADDQKFIYDNGNNPGAATYIYDTATGAAGTLYMLDIDNTASSELIFVRFWDANNASMPSVGTDVPDLCLPCPPLTRLSYTFCRGDYSEPQPEFDNGLWYNVSTINGSTGGPTDIPTVPPVLRILFHQV